MRTKHVLVRLSDDKKHLDVTEGEIEIQKNDKGTRIAWHLTDEASEGVFLPISPSGGGFSWHTTKPPPEKKNGGPFHDPKLIDDGGTLTMVDDHSSGPEHCWVYILRMEMKGVTYTTTTSGPGMGVDNPIIINR